MKNMILIVPATMQETDMTDRPAIKPLVPTERLDQLIGSGDPTSAETHDMAVELILWRQSKPAEPSAWFVKDFADGWIYFDNEADARREVDATGALMLVAYPDRIRSCLIDKPEAGEECCGKPVDMGCPEGGSVWVCCREAYPKRSPPSPLSAGDAGEIERLRSALEEAEEVLQLVEHPAFPDPQYHEQVKALGTQIGYGALMSTASAAWREFLAANGYPIGSEFVAGPCHGTVVATLQKIRSALSAWRKREK